MRLRRGEPGDVETLARMLRSSYDAMTYLPRLHTPDEDVWYVRSVLYPGNEVWVAEDGGRIVGFAALGADELLQIHVDAAAQNRGVGGRLFRHAQERRPRGFTLWTFQRNTGARRFYERHGCRVVQETDGSGNDEREPDVQYEWRPRPAAG